MGVCSCGIKSATSEVAAYAKTLEAAPIAQTDWQLNIDSEGMTRYALTQMSWPDVILTVAAAQADFVRPAQKVSPHTLFLFFKLCCNDVVLGRSWPSQ